MSHDHWHGGQPDFEIGEQRLGFCLAHRDALLRRHAVDGALDLEQFVDAAHCLKCNGRFGLLCQFEEVPAAVAPAGRLDVGVAGRKPNLYVARNQEP